MRIILISLAILAAAMIAFGGPLESSVAEFNAGIGILVPTGSTVRNCTAHSNDQGGIAAGEGSVITNCTTRINTRFGIRVDDRCRVEDNTCSESRGFKVGPGAGILITGSGSRIEGNTVTSNDVGILALAAGNIIARNTASANITSFNLAPGQTMGPIISGAAMLTNTSPWANFEH